jgi:hypothetical protein
MSEITISFKGEIEIDSVDLLFWNPKTNERISGVEWVKLSVNERNNYLINSFADAFNDAIGCEFEEFEVIAEQDIRQDISGMTSSEINKIIFQDKEPSEPVSMPLWIAEQVVEMEHLEQSLRDWAWNTLDAEDKM